MKKLKIIVIDLVAKGPNNTLWARIMFANMASIMPQVVATWCEQEGHDVKLICYTGNEELSEEIPDDIDLVFICSFTHAALMAYALSNFFRSKGVVTVLGGPHARCYPDDAINYFDYVTGFTNKTVITEIVNDCTPQHPIGKYLSSDKQPQEIPGVKERWKYIEPTLKKAPFVKIIPMLGSMGCPYTCSFCIDSTVPYQPLSFKTIKEDLQFLLTKFKKPFVSWHDPNFGIKFNDNLEVIASAAPQGSFRFAAESSLSVLTEDHLKVLKQNNFIAILPGIESWYELGNKSKAHHINGEEKVKQVSAHINTVFRYLPYVQTNFVLGLDSDEGNEPFELTKRFIDNAPAAFPGYSMLTTFGQAAPLNLEYQKENRVLPFPFHFLNNHHAMNIKPKNYEWIDFYTKVIDLTKYTFSKRAIYRRFTATHGTSSKWMNFMRAISSEGYGRIRFFEKVKDHLIHDKQFRDFFEGESKVLPDFYQNIIKQDLGQWYQWLPKEALHHDVNAYLKKTEKRELAVA